VRGQHTRTTGRRGKTAGVSKKRGWTLWISCFALAMTTLLMLCESVYNNY
jgi:hypothetical protein